MQRGASSPAFLPGCCGQAVAPSIPQLAGGCDAKAGESAQDPSASGAGSRRHVHANGQKCRRTTARQGDCPVPGQPESDLLSRTTPLRQAMATAMAFAAANEMLRAAERAVVLERVAVVVTAAVVEVRGLAPLQRR
eukprot:scaffold133041_cov31-Tisochrysis_lutea.AAC.5